MEAAKKGISVKNLKLIVTAIFLGFAVLFGILYYLNRDFTNLVNNILPINGTPSYVYSIYGSGMDGGLKKPMAVTVANEKIYVTDTGNGRVQVFDYNGNALLKFGEKGDKDGQFQFPYGIAVDTKGQIYVGDFYAHKISVFNQNGKFLKVFGKPNADYSGPGALTISGNKLYMTDINESKVMIFDLNGKKLKEFGAPGTGKGQFESPNYLTVAGSKIYVSEATNQRVQVFDLNGKYLSTFEERDPADKTGTTSWLINPRGIGIDGKGQIFVVSNLTSKIHIYNTNGKHVNAFGAMGSDDEQFRLPNGLFVDNQGRIYITDTSNERVDVYQN